MMGRNHIEWVDYAKGIGIILVVYGHVARGVLNAGIAVDKELLLLLDKLIYSFHMPLFFFLSGLFFVGSLQKRTTSGLIINKLHTLIYPYLLWSIIQLSMQIGLVEYTNFEKTFENIYSFLWQPSDHFWYLYTLFVMFSVYTLAYYMTSSISFILVLSVLTYLSYDIVKTPWSVINSVYQFGIYFGLGIAFANYKDYVFKNSHIWLAAFLVLMFLLHWGYHSMMPFDSKFYHDCILFLVAFVSIMAVVLVAQILANQKLKWLKIIGSYSLEIYLVHIIFGSGFRIIAQHALGIESSLLHLFFGTVVGVGVSIAFVKVVHRLGWDFLFISPKQGSNT